MRVSILFGMAALAAAAPQSKGWPFSKGSRGSPKTPKTPKSSTGSSLSSLMGSGKSGSGDSLSSLSSLMSLMGSGKSGSGSGDSLSSLSSLMSLMGGTGKGSSDSLSSLSSLMGSGSSSNSSLSSLNGVMEVFGPILKGEDVDVSEMVCKSFEDPNGILAQFIGGMFGNPNGAGPDEKCVKDKSGGSGPYKAGLREDPTLANHTIYMPKQPLPANEPLPVIIWGNGACLSVGTMFENFLTEIASYGIMVIANGKPKAQFIGSDYKDLIKSIDWVMGPDAKKYGKIDTSKLTVSGQSCGGLEAYKATLADNRIKLTVLFNSGYLFGSSAAEMAKFKNPIAYFLGGPKDMAQVNGETDYKYISSTGVPALLGSVPIGHLGSYYQMGGGKMGKAAVPFFRWQLKGDKSFKPLFCNPSADSKLAKLGFTMQSKNGFC